MPTIMYDLNYLNMKLQPKSPLRIYVKCFVGFHIY